MSWPALVLLVMGCKEGGGCQWPWQNGIDDLTGTAEHGEACEVTNECVPGLVCAGDGVCRFLGEPGTGQSGDECFSTEYCQAGLVCAATGFCASPGDPGTAGFGEECDTTADCQLGYLCKDEACYGIQLPLWLGAECADRDSDTGAFRAYFEVPGDAPLAEFYRLPFPNDIRVDGEGRLDLFGHPTPGLLIPEIGDVVGEVFDILEEDFAGFGNNQAVLFRFSGAIDFQSLSRGLPQDGGTWGVVDITDGSPTYGQLYPGGFRATTARGAYICYNWLAQHPYAGFPYLPGHTYAAFLGSGIQSDSGGQGVAQDDDFAEMLSPTAPTDSRLQHAWEAYQPLRGWIDSGVGPDPDDLAVAAVFTVGDPVAPMLLLRDAVLAATTPAESGLHLCASGDPGPYAGDEGRGCAGESTEFHEIQGVVSLPQFQQGLPPFKDLTDGGDIDFSSGTPTVQRTDDVHFALTIPTGVSMPAGGWPLVLYGHGTGGSYVSFARNGMVGELSDVVLDDGTHAHFAVLGIDAVHHGPRRHSENWKQSWLDLDPGAYDADVLYFNPTNPRAARDNGLQAAADYWALVRWVAGLDWTTGSPTGADIRFDMDNLYYMGHSQGSTTGVGFVAYEPEIEAAVFSGAGGLLIESLIAKKKPYDIPAAISIGLADPDIDRSHPILNLVQGGAERSDGVNHGRHVQDDTVPFDPRRHVFQTFGIGDSYTPDATQEALVRALRLEQVTNGNPAIAAVDVESTPVSGNRLGITAITVLYAPEPGAEAHFVMFERADALRQATHFLGTAWRDGVPTVVDP
jgi:hypothetical protein